jgi:hypothetical protein
MQRVGAAFEALLLEALLRPMVRDADAFGGFGATAVAQSIALHDSTGFGALIAARLHGT